MSRVKVMALCIVMCLVAEGSLAEAPKTLRIPTLSVSPDGTGNLVVLQVVFSRDRRSTSPLRVGIVEDEPSGAGQMLRASVWQAAMVAALEQRDPLSGATILVYCPGALDGESAGGVMCLAIMTALNGRTLPADFAFTGSILPDGTIGRVARIPEKMKAAAKKGVKRIIVPAFLRFEEGADGKMVDLKRLAEALGMEFIQAGHIKEAYRLVHRIPREAKVPIGREMLELPKATEDLLKQDYRRLLAEGDKIYAGISTGTRKLGMVGLPASLCADQRKKAEVAFRSGKLLLAREHAIFWTFAVRAWQATDSFFETLDKKGMSARREQMITEAEMLIASHSVDSFLAWRSPVVNSKNSPVINSRIIRDTNGRNAPDTTTQFLIHEYDIALLRGYAAQLERLAQDFHIRGNVEGIDAQLQYTMLMAEMRSRASQILILQTGSYIIKQRTDDVMRYGKRFPKAARRKDAHQVEQLLFSALMATDNLFRVCVVRPIADEEGISVDAALREMVDVDSALVGLLPGLDIARSLHRGTKDDAFPVSASAAAQTYSLWLADVSAAYTRWTELDANVTDEGELKYGRTDVLEYLLRTARENALTSIADCRRLGIPCLSPILSLERADMERDGDDADKTDVLAAYWAASLQAKTLALLFGERVLVTSDAVQSVPEKSAPR